jgi:hypothetical protein
MSMTRKRGLNRMIAVLVAATAVAAGASAVAAGAVAAHSQPSAHHALADDGVVNSKN